MLLDNRLRDHARHNSTKSSTSKIKLKTSLTFLLLCFSLLPIFHASTCFSASLIPWQISQQNSNFLFTLCKIRNMKLQQELSEWMCIFYVVYTYLKQTDTTNAAPVENKISIILSITSSQPKLRNLMLMQPPNIFDFSERQGLWLVGRNSCLLSTYSTNMRI